MSDCRSAVIAGTHSSAGKTTWFLALASFLRRKGYSVWETTEKSFVEPYRIGEREGEFYDGHLLASYQHLRFGQRPELAKNFVRAALARSRRRHVHSS